MNERQLADQFFRDNPGQRDGVWKAYYAYHAGHFRQDPGAHNFTSGSPDSVCQWCGRSRLEVRHDLLEPECQARPALPSIPDVLLSEERNFLKLLERAEREVPKLVARHGMSGQTLAMLHSTYGYDPETVSAAVAVPDDIRVAYENEREQEQELSRSRIVRQIITAK